MVCHHFLFLHDPQLRYLSLHRAIRSVSPTLYILGVDAGRALLHSVAETSLVALQRSVNQRFFPTSHKIAQCAGPRGYGGPFAPGARLATSGVVQGEKD